MSKRDDLIQRLYDVIFLARLTSRQALEDATTFVDEAMKLGREQTAAGEPPSAPFDAAALRRATTDAVRPGHVYATGGSFLFGVTREDVMDACGALRASDVICHGAPYQTPEGWYIDVQWREKAQPARGDKIGEPYQGPDGRWLMKLIGGSVLSFKDEQEARTFAAQREALVQSGKVAAPPRCEIVGDSLRVRDTSGATECVLNLRDVSFVNRLADEYSDGTATVWIVLRVGETFKLDLPTVADYERVADHVAALRGSKSA
jgi:hypothetical protein